ncbi:MAG: PIG-L family deacetylase, partial [Myxococcaceae bacterium]
MRPPSIALGAMLSMTAVAAPTQTPPQLSAGEISAGMKRLGVIGSVLYVAAHPDDENTRLLAWLVGERGVRAGYLSLTRGDGGQNLIGSEQDVLLGLVRTHELLAARRIDGAEQLFTRARDFGYSKNADETLRIWGREQVLGDVVYAIRKFRPDVIITRFNTQPPNHGHHTASALLAAEAFTAAADPSRFPEQLKTVLVWKTDRLLHNVSTWFLPPNTDMSSYLSVDTGGFDPLRGKSWGEVAAASRSQHKSQGFGVPAERGQLLEYFSSLAGTKPTKDLLEGLELGWKKWPQLAKAIGSAAAAFDPRAPHKSVPALIAIHGQLSALPKEHPYRERKLRDTEALLVACAGLFLEARAPEPAAAPGEMLQIEVHALNRSPVAVRLGATPLQKKLLKLPQPLKLEENAPLTTPYWLRARPTPGLFVLEGADATLLTEPDAGAPVSVPFEVSIGGKTFTVQRPLVYVWTDPVRGELSRPFEIAPPITVTPGRDVLMFPNGWPQTLAIDLASGRAQAQGQVSLELPTGWTAEPAVQPFQLTSRTDEKTVT